MAVDGSGNVYIADTGNNAIKELPRAFVPAGRGQRDGAAGSDALLPVLPTTQPLTGVFAPSSDQSWLTIGTIANGVVNFSFTAKHRRRPHGPHHRARPADHRDPGLCSLLPQPDSVQWDLTSVWPKSDVDGDHHGQHRRQPDRHGDVLQRCDRHRFRFLSTTNGVTSASITTSVLPAGSDSLSATYSGDIEDSGSTGSLTLSINKAHLTVAADNQAKTYDGLVFTLFTVHFTGFVNGENAGTAAITGTPTFSGAAVTAVNASAGSYPIHVDDVSGLSAANYDFTASATDGALTISQAALTITATAFSKTYDGTTTALAMPAVSGLQSADTVTGLAELFLSKNVAGTERQYARRLRLHDQRRQRRQ